MTKTYTKRPPDSAKAAQRAWDYFAATYPARKIETLSYSPKCEGLPGWVCELEKPADATKHWGTGYWSDWWLKSETAAHIKRWAM